jgi:hypothetical protein
MPAFTTPDNIPYPLGTDPVVPLAERFEDIAEAVQDAININRSQLTTDLAASKLFLETETRTADYTLALTDANKVVPMNKATAGTLTVPLNSSVAFPIGTVIGVYNLSSALVEVVGAAGVTVRNNGFLDQYIEVSLRKRATDEWVLAGLVS